MALIGQALETRYEYIYGTKKKSDESSNSSDFMDTTAPTAVTKPLFVDVYIYRQ